MPASPNLWLRDLSRCAGLGAVAGGIEAIGLAASLRAPLGVGGFVLLGVVAVVVMALVGAVLGIATSAVVRPLRRDEADERVGATVMAVVGTLLCGWYLWGACLTLVDQGRLPVAVLFGLLPLPFGFIVSFNARYWLRRSRRGDSRVPWPPVALGVAVVLVAVAAVAHAVRDTGGRGALAGDPSVVWVTVSDLRMSETGDAWLADTDDAVRFTHAITPSTTVRPAAAALLTGLHPLRAGVVGDTMPLSAGQRTLADVFADEGYATAAFTADGALDRFSGFERGFRVYDDRPGTLGAAGYLALFRRLGLARGERGAGQLVDAFAGWHASHTRVPHFAWVQVPADGADAAIARIVDTVQASEAASSTFIGVVGLQRADAVGVSDREVRVPLVFHAPGTTMTKTTVAAQVRIYDLGATSLEFAQLSAMPVTEGIPLIGYGTGQRSVALPVVTLAPTRIGLRSGGVAYEQDLDGGQQRIFDLAQDPTEDVSSSQAAALEQARGMLAPEVTSYKGLLGVNP